MSRSIPFTRRSSASIFLLLLTAFICQAVQARDYYLSTSGNDAASGIAAASAWQTINRLNSADLQPGDRVYLEGGQIFTGPIIIEPTDAGSAALPVRISSYGSGRATIEAGSGSGIISYNAAGIEIANLVIIGSNAPATTGSGIYFLIEQTNNDLEHIVIEDVEISGFGKNGILIGSNNTSMGFNDLVIRRCLVHDNGYSGIESFGSWPAITHQDFLIEYCVVYNNRGDATVTNRHTGNGILVSGVDNATVQFCEAYNNGENNAATAGGPIGIWVYDARNVRIRSCESHHNKAGGNKDGGGFGIDGGASNCVIEFCYSHDNEGAGFGLFEYGSPNPWQNNMVRFNISQNDGRKNGYGGLSFWGADALHPLDQVQVYNNTIFQSAAGLINGQPSAVQTIGSYMNGVDLKNNIFYATGNTRLLDITGTPGPANIIFRNNDYFATNPVFNWSGVSYGSLTDWRVGAAGQETNSGQATGFDGSPMLVAPGGAAGWQPASNPDPAVLGGYRLQSSSPLINTGMNIAGMCNRDFFGTSIAPNGAVDIGAAKFISTVLPSGLTNFSGTRIANVCRLTWNDDLPGGSFVVERSENGRNFLPRITLAANATGRYAVNDTVQQPSVAYRIQSTGSNGAIRYSQVLWLRAGPSVQIRYVREGAAGALLIDADRGIRKKLLIATTSGALLFQEEVALIRGTNRIALDKGKSWPKGMYLCWLEGETAVPIYLH